MHESDEILISDGISVEIADCTPDILYKVFEISLGTGSEHTAKKVVRGEPISVYIHGRKGPQPTNMVLRKRVLRTLVLRELQVHRKLVLPDFQARTGFIVPEHEYEDVLYTYTRNRAAVVEWITDKEGIVTKSWRITDPHAARRVAWMHGLHPFRSEAIEAIKARASEGKAAS